MPGRVILGVDFGDLKYFPPFKRGVFYCWYCMMHKWWALMTAAHSHLSSLCKLPSARNGLCPNKKQRSSAEYQPLGWAELWRSWKDCLVIDAASSFCDWLSDKIGAPWLGNLHALLLLLCSQMNIQQWRTKLMIWIVSNIATDHGGLYTVFTVRQCYIWEKRWMTWLLLFQQYSSKILQISNESILWPE